MKSKGTGNIPVPNVGPKNGGNLPSHNVGDAPGPKGNAGSPSGTAGSYTKGCAVGTAKHK